MKFYKYKDKNVFICSCYQHNIDISVVEYQKKVFDFFDIPINQYKTELRHPMWMESIINSTLSDIILFFDVDCIPLTEDAVDFVLEKTNERSVCGIEQQCNCNSSIDHVYAGPACLSIHRKTIEKLAPVKFNETPRGDVGEEFTYKCEETNITLNFLRLTNCIEPIWNINFNRKFGPGSTYENKIYHQFQIRNINQQQKFISKCKEVLNER
jgi:hypothetical protein